MVQGRELDIELPDVVTHTLVSQSDTLQEAEPVYAILLTPPPAPEPAPRREDQGLGLSFILTALFLLFLIIALRFRNNLKYVVTMFQNLVGVKMRQNVFDDTVRETSLIFLLNLLWCASTGILGYSFIDTLFPEAWDKVGISVGILIGMGIAAVYSLFMWGAYYAIGSIFSDRNHSEIWVKGFTASQAIMAPAFFITAIFAISEPELAIPVAMASAIIFIAVKLVFIWKSYRIFFYQFSSWVLFLCYLCSLEIVPVILCFRSARYIGNVL